MLTIDELININYIPKSEEISLRLLVDFFRLYLCNRIYVIQLEDGTNVKLIFSVKDLYHLSGIVHIYEGVPMSSERFLKLVENGNLEIDHLKKVNSNAFKDYVDRICSVACIETIIKNCEYLCFTGGVIPGHSIKVKYLLLKGINEKNLHLGIDCYNINRPFFPRTLLITEGNSKQKYIDKADSKQRVSKIEVLDKDTNAPIETINRDLAIDKAKDTILQKIEEWEELFLIEKIRTYFREISSELKIQVVLNSIRKNMNCIKHITEIYLFPNQDVIYSLESLKQAKDEVVFDWTSIIFGIIIDMIKEKSLIIISDYYSDDIVVHLKSFDKDCYKSSIAYDIKTLLETEKNTIISEVSIIDRYWANKIVSKQSNEFLKLYRNCFDIKFRDLISNNKKLIFDSFMNSICEDNMNLITNELCDLLYAYILDVHSDV